MTKEQLNKNLKIIFYPIAFIISFTVVFFGGGVEKIGAQGILVIDEMTAPAPITEYLSQSPVSIISIFVILIFIIYLYRGLIKQFFTIQLSTGKLIIRVVKHCFVWSFLYYLLLAIIFIFVLKMGFSESFYSTVVLYDSLMVIFIILLFFPFFLLLNLISGIELFFISIKDRRFLVSGFILFFSSLLLIFLVSYLTSLYLGENLSFFKFYYPIYY